MARFNYSGVAITGGTGRLNSSLGGTVLMRNGVVRNYVTPINPSTTLQQGVRNIFSTASKAWALSLSDAQRHAYIAAAGSGNWAITDPFTGSTRNPTGFTLFLSLFKNLATLGYATVTILGKIENVPVPNLTQLTISSVTADATTGVITVTVAAEPNVEFAVIYAAPPVGGGRMTYPSATARLIVANEGGGAVVITTECSAKYGAITGLAGKKIHIGVVTIDSGSGKASSLLTAVAVISA